MTQWRRFGLAVLALLVVGGAIWLVRTRSLPEGLGPAIASTARPAEEPVRIGYSRLRISLPIFVAQEKGLFKKHGVAAELVMYDTAQPMAQALIEDKVPLAGYTALPITYAAMVRSGKQLYFSTLMMEDEQHRISFLLRRRTPESSSSQVDTIRDLRGKKVGILPTIAYKVWLEAILEANGVERDSETIQNVEPLLQGKTLASGGVDALFTNDPAATAAIASGVAEAVNTYAEVPRFLGSPFPFGSFNASKSWADAHPETFSAVIAALDEAVAFVNEHPREAKELMKSFLPEVFRPHVALYPDALYLSSGQAAPEMFQRAADDYLRLGIISERLDLRPLVVTRLQPGAGAASGGARN